MKKFLILFLAAFTCFSVIPVHAAETQLGQLSVKVSYSPTVTPQDGDTFTISYRDNAGATGTVDVNAYEYADRSCVAEMEAGSYVVTDITYNGSSEEVITQGFAVNTSFQVQSGGVDELILGIGTSQAGSVYSLYPDSTIAKLDGETVGDWYAALSERQMQEETSDTSEASGGNGITQEEADQLDSGNSGQGTTGDPSEDAEVIYYDEEGNEQDDEERTEFSIVKGLPVMIAAVIVAVVLIVLHKKGKF